MLKYNGNIILSLKNMIDINDSWYRVSIKAIVYNNEGKILLCKEENGVWDLPGGGLEHGEDITTCLVREIKEEMGIKIIDISKNPLCFATFHKTYSNKRPWISNVCYEVKLENLDFIPSNECVEIGFFDNDLVQNIDVIGNVKEVFKELFSI